jgi:hypothetical protein
MQYNSSRKIHNACKDEDAMMSGEEWEERNQFFLRIDWRLRTLRLNLNGPFVAQSPKDASSKATLLNPDADQSYVDASSNDAPECACRRNKGPFANIHAAWTKTEQGYCRCNASENIYWGYTPWDEHHCW